MIMRELKFFFALFTTMLIVAHTTNKLHANTVDSLSSIKQTHTFIK